MLTSTYKLVSTPGMHFRYQVIQPQGLPDVHLTLFANDLLLSLSESSVPIYMREILAMVNWMACDTIVTANGWRLLGSPSEVRSVIRHYLTVIAKCKVMSRPDTFGLKVTYVNQTSGTHIQVRILLAALKRFYDLLISAGEYAYANPLVHEDASRIAVESRHNVSQAVRRAIQEGAPVTGWLRSRAPLARIRLSENYFRYVEHDWMPTTINDPDFPNAVYSAGKEHGWGLRELCVVRTLFEAGPRISEVFSLTAADWARSQFMNKFDSRSKGSHGLRVKVLVVSPPTAKIYRRYFDDGECGRRARDAKRLTVRELTKLVTEDPGRLAETHLFLTDRGTPMTAKLFRDYYWRPALNAAGVEADPHLCRHWFVTNALNNIDRVAKTEVERLRLKEALVTYMAWRDGERTLKAYEHTQKMGLFEKTLQVIHKKMGSREKEFSLSVKAQGQGVELAPLSEPDSLDDDLCFLLGEDDD